jgi:hypothetical protein
MAIDLRIKIGIDSPGLFVSEKMQSSMQNRSTNLDRSLATREWFGAAALHPFAEVLLNLASRCFVTRAAIRLWLS